MVFERYRRLQEAVSQPVPSVTFEEQSSRGPFKRFYRIFRWVVLALIVLVVVLILRQSDPPVIDSDPRAARRVEVKLQDLQNAREAGSPHKLKLKEAEVNSWLGSNLVLRPAPEAAPAPDPSLEEVQSSMRDVKIDLLDDRLRAYVVFDYRGKNLSLLLEGRLRADNGYIRFEPTAGKLGTLPLPGAVLERSVTRLFESPENREKFRLPPEVADIRVENGELVVSYR
ncbi:MAG: hypothetical protein ACR2L2_06805 [Acidobacteriota bacterium]